MHALNRVTPGTAAHFLKSWKGEQRSSAPARTGGPSTQLSSTSHALPGLWTIHRTQTRGMKIPMCEEMGRNTEVIEKTGQREVSHAICQSESKTEMSSQA